MNNHLDRLEKATPSVRAAYAALLKAGRALGPVRADPKKTSIHLMRETAFAGVTIRRESLILTLKSEDPIDNERVEKAEQASAKRWHNEIRLTSARDVDAELRKWIAASYELSGKSRID
jgi:cytochrome c556